MIQLSQIMENRTYPESGKVLYDSMAPLLAQDQSVTLDLSGVISLPSMFLNASFGKAAKNYGSEIVKKNIVFYHVSRAQAERLREYFSRL